MNILEEIIVARKRRVELAKQTRPPDLLHCEAEAARRSRQPHKFLQAFANGSRLNIIAEFKRRSPSKGIIRADVDPVSIARAYEQGGAAAISVLTEEDYFSGSLADLTVIRHATNLPLLRKDFIVDQYQVYEAAAAGADALLLIVAALSDQQLLELRTVTENELGLDALVEVHTGEELSRAVSAGAKLIGVNNRDLRTFAVSLATSVELARSAPADVVLISESGLHTRADLLSLQGEGVRGFLIGETLMRAARPAEALRVLLGDESSDC